jgi:hypothetical protein
VLYACSRFAVTAPAPAEDEHEHALHESDEAEFETAT